MGDDVKIGVRVEGAEKAKTDLQGVAGAEQQVGQANDQAVKGIDKAAQAKDNAAKKAQELALKSRGLREQLSALGPEFGIVADLIGTFTTAMTPAAMAAGVVSAAVVALTMAYRSNSQEQEKQKEHTRQLIQDLVLQAQEYGKLAEEVERVNRAESLRRPGGEPVAPAPLLKELAGYGETAGIGKAAIESAATAAASGRVLTGPHLEALALWYALGYGEGYQTPAAARQAFLSQWQRQGNLLDSLRTEKRILDERLGTGYKAAKQAEASEVAASTSQSAQSAAVIASVAGRETTAGRYITPEKLAEEMTQYLLYAPDAKGAKGRSLDWHKEWIGRFQELFARYPELADVQLSEVRGGWRDRLQNYTISAPGQGGTPFAELLRDRSGLPVSIPENASPAPSAPYAARRNAAVAAEVMQESEAQKKGQPAIQNNTIYHGGTHTHVSGGVDPAGKALTPAGQYE